MKGPKSMNVGHDLSMIIACVTRIGPTSGPSLGYVQEMNRSPDKEGLFLAECDADVNGIYRA